MEDEVKKELIDLTEQGIKLLEKDCFEGKLNKHGQLEDEGAPEDEI